MSNTSNTVVDLVFIVFKQRDAKNHDEISKELSKSVLIALFAFQIVKNSLFEAKMTKKGSFLTNSNRSLRCFRFMNRYHTTRGFYSMLNSPKFIEI